MYFFDLPWTQHKTTALIKQHIDIDNNISFSEKANECFPIPLVAVPSIGFAHLQKKKKKESTYIHIIYFCMFTFQNSRTTVNSAVQKNNPSVEAHLLLIQFTRLSLACQSLMRCRLRIISQSTERSTSAKRHTTPAINWDLKKIWSAKHRKNKK